MVDVTKHPRWYPLQGLCSQSANRTCRFLIDIIATSYTIGSNYTRSSLSHIVGNAKAGLPNVDHNRQLWRPFLRGTKLRSYSIHQRLDSRPAVQAEYDNQEQPHTDAF